MNTASPERRESCDHHPEKTMAPSHVANALLSYARSIGMTVREVRDTAIFHSEKLRGINFWLYR